MPETSKYAVIAAGLRAEILSGEYGPGARLPSANRLMKKHGIQRATAERVLGQLVEWGIADAVKGRGTFVRAFQPIIRDGIRRLGAESWPAGASIWASETEGRALAVDQIEVTETGVTQAGVGDLLGLGVGEGVVLRSRRYVLDGKPVLLAESWLPASIASGTRLAERDTGPGGIYGRLEEMGRAPTRFREDLRSLMPGPEIAGRLEMRPGTPVVEIVRTAFDADGAVVEVNQMTADSSAYIFRYDFGA